VTVQFKFKTSVTGVYGVSLANSAKNRSNYQIITVADTSEHEYSLTFTMDTTGTWLYTNGVGLYLAICLSAGSNFQGTAGSMGCRCEADDFRAVQLHVLDLEYRVPEAHPANPRLARAGVQARRHPEGTGEGAAYTFRDFANAADTVATFSNPGEKLSAMSAASTANTQAPYFRAHVVASARLS
jgi:hypothetical protein